MFDSLLLLVVGAIGAALGIVLKPLTEKWLERIFAQKPAFSVKPITIRNSWTVLVEPINRPASRRRPLSVCFQGSLFRDQGELQGDGEISWKVDLSAIDGFADSLVENSRSELQLFFDPDRKSENIKFNLAVNSSLGAPAAGRIPTEFVETPVQLAESIKSNCKIVVRARELNVSRAFPTTTSLVSWESVFDGKEMIVAEISGLEIDGIQTTLLADPAYGWVLTLRGAKNIALRNLTIGHAKPGYCTGGVVRLIDCEKVSIENCDLFGCGTYGLEINSCKDINIVGSVIRDCTYGIMQLKDVSNVVFSGCKFLRNKQFGLCSFSGAVDQVMFNGCLFEGNRSVADLFNFHDITKPGSGVFIWDSRFIENQCARFSDGLEYISENQNTRTNNDFNAFLKVEYY